MSKHPCREPRTATSFGRSGRERQTRTSRPPGTREPTSNGHVVSGPDPAYAGFKILRASPAPVDRRFPTAAEFNNAYPGVEFQYGTTTVASPTSGIFESPGAEDYRVTKSATVTGWTGITIGQQIPAGQSSSPTSVDIQAELLMSGSNNPSRVGARFHT